MLIIFYIFFFLQVASLYFLQESSAIDIVIYLYIFLDAIILIIFFAQKTKGKIFLCILLSLLLRFAFLIYMQRTGFQLSLDWHNFLSQTIAYMTGVSKTITMYPRVLFLFFESTGFNCNFTVLPITLNIFCSIVNIYTVFLILQYLKVNPKIKNYIICTLCFLPIQIAYSLEMIREALPTLFISISLFFFTKWFFSNKFHYIALSFLLAFISSSFHAGCIAVALGYAYTFVFYDFKRNKLQITLNKILLCFPFVILLATYIFLNSDIFLGQFSGLNDIESLEAQLISYATLDAGSRYLTWLSTQSLSIQALFSPLKAIYFLFSPMIYDVRGILDIVVLFADSSIFIIAVIYYLYSINKVNDKKIRIYISVLFFILCMVALIFGLGTSNTGTAMRHRNKFIAIPMVFIAVIYTYNSTKTIFHLKDKAK